MVIWHQTYDKGPLKIARGNLHPPLHGLFFPISSNGFLYAPPHRQDSTYHGCCYSSHVPREIAQWVHHEGSIQRPIAQ